MNVCRRASQGLCICTSYMRLCRSGSRRCCLQELSRSAQWGCYTCRLTMIRLQQHCRRQQWREAEWCRRDRGCTCVSQPFDIAASRNYLLLNSFRCTRILVSISSSSSLHPYLLSGQLLSVYDSVSTLWSCTRSCIDCIPEQTIQTKLRFGPDTAILFASFPAWQQAPY